MFLLPPHRARHVYRMKSLRPPGHPTAASMPWTAIKQRRYTKNFKTFNEFRATSVFKLTQFNSFQN